MAYDKNLANRINDLLIDQPDIVEKKMFGGIGYLLNGNMACGVIEDNLIVRIGIGPDQYLAALEKPHDEIFNMTGRPMTGWVMIEPEGTKIKHALESWVKKDVAFAMTLPPQRML